MSDLRKDDIPRWRPKEQIRSDGHSILFVGGQGTGKTTLMFRCVPANCNIFVLAVPDAGPVYDLWTSIAGVANVTCVHKHLNTIQMPPGWTPPTLTSYAKQTTSGFKIEGTKQQPLGLSYTLIPNGTAARAFLWILRLVHIQQQTKPESLTVLIMDDILSAIQSDTSRNNAIMDDIRGVLTTLRHKRILLLTSAHFFEGVYEFAACFDTWILTSLPRRLPGAASEVFCQRLPNSMIFEEFKEFWKRYCAPVDDKTRNRAPRFSVALDEAFGLFILSMKNQRRIHKGRRTTREQERVTAALSQYIAQASRAQVSLAREYFAPPP